MNVSKSTEQKKPLSREEYLIKLMFYIGVPYIWGGSNPNQGLDCSGFAQLALQELGLDPKGDQSADTLMKYFLNEGYQTPMTPDLGDLVFFGPTKDHATHVGVCVDRIFMVEAGGGGSKILTVADAQRVGARVRIAARARRSDQIAILRPLGLPWHNQASTDPTTVSNS